MTPTDKTGRAILPGAKVRMVGTVERVTREGIAVKVRDGRSVYLEPDLVEVVADDAR